MAITGDYPRPVTVNGFSCKNCTDVDYAKKHIDPAHPKDGPYGVNAREKEKPIGAEVADKPGRPRDRARKVWSAPGVALDVDA